MRVLLTGATGFIGRALAQALRSRGHEVVRVSRSARSEPGSPALQADFAQVPPREWWLPHVSQVDAVVNAVGILQETDTQRFETLHTRAPIELFEACAAARVRRVIQVSALGADAEARSRYHLSKRAADEALRGLPLASAVIVQPSLVYGANGTSAALFNTMAAAPLLMLPHRGDIPVQPVHVQDVVDGVVALVEDALPGQRTVAFSGPRPMALADYLGRLRRVLGLRGRLRVLPLPEGLFRSTARLIGRLRLGMLDEETADMLLRGNAADSGAFARLLGRPPREVEAFVDPGEQPALRAQAALGVWSPVLRAVIGFVWVWTGIVSLGLYPVEESYDLLARVGLTGAPATVALYGAALLDLAFGVLTWVLPARRRPTLWAAQLALIAGYTLLITVFLREYWLHPYGPILKNLPMMAAIGLLWSLEPAGRER